MRKEWWKGPYMDFKNEKGERMDWETYREWTRTTAEYPEIEIKIRERTNPLLESSGQKGNVYTETLQSQYFIRYLIKNGK